MIGAPTRAPLVLTRAERIVAPAASPDARDHISMVSEGGLEYDCAWRADLGKVENMQVRGVFDHGGSDFNPFKPGGSGYDVPTRVGRNHVHTWLSKCPGFGDDLVSLTFQPPTGPARAARCPNGWGARSVR